MAAAAGGLHQAGGGSPLVRITQHAPTAVRVAEPGAVRALPAELPLTPEDDAWIERGRVLLATPLDRTLADQPAVLSVSALKELARRERDEDMPTVLDVTAPHLSSPVFADEATSDGRAIGTACHRFLQFAEFGRVTTVLEVRAQLDRLIAAGALSPEEAGLVPVADVVWLSTTDVGKRLARPDARARREVPFVYSLPLAAAGEHTIVRGVIDCLLDTPEGLVILDYKTDAPASDEDFAARWVGYTVQVQLYAQAAGSIFGRPVVRAVLAFLRARRMVDVPLTTHATAP